MKFLDTNVIIRFLTRDDEEKAGACYQLLQRANYGTETLLICEAIITEVVYVLSSRRAPYQLTHEEIRSRLAPIIAIRGLRLPQKHLYINALNIYAEHRNLDFEDALAIAHMRHQSISEIISYDRDYDRVPGIQRSEPLASDLG